MVHLQVSISEHLHHTIFSMLFEWILEAHCAQILSCSNPQADVWFIAQPIFPTFRLSSPIFSTMFWTWLKLPHLSIVGLIWCVYTHPFNPKGVHVLCRTHGNERIGTHNDAPPSSLMDSTMNPKVKIVEGEGVGVRSLARNTLGVKGCAGAPRWD
jgi:hypothetical protein